MPSNKRRKQRNSAASLPDPAVNPVLDDPVEPIDQQPDTAPEHQEAMTVRLATARHIDGKLAALQDVSSRLRNGDNSLVRSAVDDLLGEASAEELDLIQQALRSRIAQVGGKSHPDDELSENWRDGGYPYRNKMSRRRYEQQKYELQVELLKLQAWVRSRGERVIVLFEGRDAAGKGGTIKRFMEHLNPRGARSSRWTSRPRRSGASGTSSATAATSPRAARSCCSTARGTTAPASSA